MLHSQEDIEFYDKLRQNLKESFESIIYSQENLTNQQKNIINYYVSEGVSKGVRYVYSEIRFLDMGD